MRGEVGIRKRHVKVRSSTAPSRKGTAKKLHVIRFLERHTGGMLKTCAGDRCQRALHVTLSAWDALP